MTSTFLRIVTTWLLLLTPSSEIQTGDSPKIEGDWEGTLKINNLRTLRLVYHIKKAADGTYSATHEMSAAGPILLKIASVKYEAGSVSIKREKAGVTAQENPPQEFVGKVAEDGKSIAGAWFYGAGQAAPLKLVPAGPAPKPEQIWECKEKNSSGREDRFLLNLYKGKDGSIRATLDFPDSHEFEIDVEPIKFDNEKLAFKCALLGSEYTGNWNAEKTEIQGFWEQQGTKKPRVFRRLGKIPPNPKTPCG